MCNYSERVHKGALLLDEYKATWYQDVNPDTLNMNMPWMLDGQGDVLAQVFSQEQDTLDSGGYYIGVQMLNLNPADVIHNGFELAPMLSLDEIKEGYQALADAWRREIKIRQKQLRP